MTASHRRFPGGKTATAMFSLELGACNSSTVFGTAGRIVVPDSHAPSRVSLVEVPRIALAPSISAARTRRSRVQALVLLGWHDQECLTTGVHTISFEARISFVCFSLRRVDCAAHWECREAPEHSGENLLHRNSITLNGTLLDDAVPSWTSAADNRWW